MIMGVSICAFVGENHGIFVGLILNLNKVLSAAISNFEIGVLGLFMLKGIAHFLGKYNWLTQGVCNCYGQLSIQKEEAKKKEVHVEDNVPAPSPRSNCSVTLSF